jgi:hypothetical protein
VGHDVIGKSTLWCSIAQVDDGPGRSTGAGETTAQEAAAQLGNGVLVSPSATVTTRGDEVTVTVTGSAEQLVPGLVLNVTDSASAPREELPRTT